MRRFLGRRFAAAAAGVAMSALAACATTDEIGNNQPAEPPPPAPPESDCIEPAYIERGMPEKAGNKRLTALYNRVKATRTGGPVMEAIARDWTRICLNPALDEPDADGFIMVGRYRHYFDKIELNPAFGDERVLPLTLVHEGRHRLQPNEFSAHGNFSETDRIILHWLNEADARLTALLYAYEAEQKGNPGHMNWFSATEENGPLAAAFRQSLESDPDNMQEAMGAVIRAFHEHEIMSGRYKKGITQWIEIMSAYLNPDRPQDKLFSDGDLYRLGDMGEWGNYMTPELISYIRNSVTGADYERLRQDPKIVLQKRLAP